MSADAWTTLRVTMPSVALDDSAISEATEQLDALAALLATSDEVGGVETRDPSFITEGAEFVTVERPELIVYTIPSARAAVEASVRALALTLGLAVVVEGEDHEGDEWRDAWKRYHRSLRIRAGGVELMIRPSWIPREPDDPTCELILDPGRAFGTGLHESTRLCLQALVELAAQTPEDQVPRRVLDLGCGSGILGLAASKLWPQLEQLCFADHDPEAVETARENSALNDQGLTAQLEFRQLSLGPDAPSPALAPAPLVFANIRPEVLIPAAPTLCAAVEPGGLLILSGILDDEADEVLAAHARLELRAQPREGGWCALILARPAGLGASAGLGISAGRET